MENDYVGTPMPDRVDISIREWLVVSPWITATFGSRCLTVVASVLLRHLLIVGGTEVLE